jgi:hypothetical protein
MPKVTHVVEKDDARRATRFGSRTSIAPTINIGAARLIHNRRTKAIVLLAKAPELPATLPPRGPAHRR